MAFRRRSAGDGTTRLAALPGTLALSLARALLKVSLGAATVAALLGGLLYLRLSQGPIHLPWVATAASRLVSQDSGQLKLDVGDVIVTLGEAGSPSGVQFVDVEIADAAGQRLFAIPRLAASFYSADLLAGRIRPTRIVLIRPVTEIELRPDGTYRFGLGPPGQTESIAGGDPSAGNAEAVEGDAIRRLLDGLTGDEAILPLLSRLQQVAVLDTDLTFVNEAAGRRWRTRGADMIVRRTAAGLSGRLAVGLADGVVTGAEVTVDAERRRGRGGEIDLSIRYSNLRPEHLAEQIAGMQWLRLFDAPVGGQLNLTVRPDGTIVNLAGSLAAGPGRLLAVGASGNRFDRTELDFSYVPDLERVLVDRFELTSPAVAAQMSGFVDLDLAGGRALDGLAGQFDVARLHVSLPGVFVDPLDFDGGQLVARLAMAPLVVEVAEANLRHGPLVLGVSGRARAEAQGWRTELRASGQNMTVAQLLQHWPLAAARGARDWVLRNIREGMIDEAVALMQFTGEEPRLNLDFAFSELVSGYLREMTPIRHAYGRGSLTLDSFDIVVDRAEVEPVPGAPLRIDGSFAHMSDIQAKPSHADINLRVTGPSASVLALIDEEPLGFPARLGLDPATVGGGAEVKTRLQFPLLKDLELADVEVESLARLSALSLPFGLRGNAPVDVRGEGVALRATTEAMRLAGPITVEGVPVALDWIEHYGRGSNHREVALEGPVTPVLLGRLGVGINGLSGGSLPLRLNLVQTGGDGYDFRLSGDAGPAQIVVAPLGWEKQPGAPGTVEAAGVVGERLQLSHFSLVTEELEAAGAADLGSDDEILAARIDRLRYRGLADISATLATGDDGVRTVSIRGRRLDLALLDTLPERDPDGAGAGQPAPEQWQVDFRIDEMVLRPRIISRPATGTLTRAADGRLTIHLGGQADGEIPFVVDYQEADGDKGVVVLNSADAGGLLHSTGLFQGAHGGRLDITAEVDRQGGLAARGVARISDVTVQGAPTFTSILDAGGVDRAAEAAKSGGLHFKKVKIPFSFLDGILSLDRAVAKGNLLAVTANGTVDRDADEVDLVGVITPAYGVTGVLDNIPLLGNILSGGQGEGIVGMTFTVKGPTAAPDFTVNPLSLLTPGILRKVFSGRSNPPDEAFLDQLKRDED